MSGSPKYTTVAYDAAREAARRRAQAAERRRREEERRRRAAEAAERRKRARAEIVRRNAELAAERAARDAAVAATVRKESEATAARGLRDVSRLLAQARTGSHDSARLGGFEARLDILRARLAQHPGSSLDGAIEELRGEIVQTWSTAPSGPAARADRTQVLAGLARQLATPGPKGAELDDAGHRRCATLLDELQAAARDGQHIRFEALLGTAEYEINRHVTTVAQRLQQAADQARAQQQATERAQSEEQAAEQAAEQARAEEQASEQAHAADLAEARDRLDVLDEAVRAAIADARGFTADDLADRLSGPLAEAERALRADAPQPALDAVARLEQLLPEVESHLDELQLAHERRADVARAVKDAMTGEGLAFTGGEELDTRFVLRFERPNGALYETAVGSETDGTPLLVYRVEGEPDVVTLEVPEGAVCDATEQLLNRVHRAMGEDGFVPGELQWQGKPPGRAGRTLPGDETGRVR